MDLRALRTFRFGSENIRRGMPVTMNEARAREHLAKGLVEAAAARVRAPQGEDGLEARTVADLRELASTGGIDLGEAAKKADIIAAIRAHREKA